MDKKQLEEFEARLKKAEDNTAALAAEKEALETKVKEYEKAGMQTLLGGGNHTGNRTNSDEARCLSMFGLGHVKQLLDINVADPRYSRIPAEVKYTAIQFKKDFQNARFISQLFYDQKFDKIGATEDTDRFAATPNILKSKFAQEVLVPKLKAFGTTVVGGGAEWIPTAMSSTYIPEFELEREIVGYLRSIDMPTSPYELPMVKNMTKARRGTEGVTATASNFNTDQLEFKAKKLLEYYILPEELREDSIIPILELARMELTEAHKRAFEAAVINGVEFGVAHIDADTQAGAADLAEKSWHGFRKLALANSANGSVVDFGNGVVSDVNLAKMRQKLGKFGIDPTMLMWVTGAISYLQMCNTTNVVTVDKMGPNAVILKGQLGAYSGIPIIQSGYIREDLNATGVQDGVTVDRTGLLLVRKDRFYFATRRPVRLALREAKSADDRYEIASYSRTDFVGMPQSATEVSVAYGVNVARS